MRAAGDHVDRVGLVDQQISRYAARVIPVETPLEIALLVEVRVRRGAQELFVVGVIGVCVSRDLVAPGRKG